MTKCNSTEALPVVPQQVQKKPSQYQKQQCEQASKKGKINDSWADKENTKMQKSVPGKGQPQNLSKTLALRVINPNLIQSKNSDKNWNLSIDSNPPSAKSFCAKIENMIQDESLDIGTPELIRDCSSPFFSDNNTPTFSAKSLNDSFSGLHKKASNEGSGHDPRKLKKDLQLSPKTKAFFDDTEKKRKELNGKGSITDLVTFYLGLLPDVQPKYHWKLFLDVAEACKKECSYKYAKFFYKQALALQPYSPDVRELSYDICVTFTFRSGLSMLSWKRTMETFQKSRIS